MMNVDLARCSLNAQFISSASLLLVGHLALRRGACVGGEMGNFAVQFIHSSTLLNTSSCIGGWWLMLLAVLATAHVKINTRGMKKKRNNDLY
jgi:hypothetical protein